LTNRIQNF